MGNGVEILAVCYDLHPEVWYHSHIPSQIVSFPVDYWYWYSRRWIELFPWLFYCIIEQMLWQNAIPTGATPHSKIGWTITWSTKSVLTVCIQIPLENVSIKADVTELYDRSGRCRRFTEFVKFTWFLSYCNTAVFAGNSCDEVSSRFTEVVHLPRKFVLIYSFICRLLSKGACLFKF